MSNELLRAHVQRVGFDLTLTHTMIEVLVWLNEVGKKREYRGHAPTRAVSVFVTPVMGLGRRGLVVHHYDTEALSKLSTRERENQPLSTFYTITPAGHLVIGLLKEAGIYEATEFILFPERFTRTGKRRALKSA